MIPMKYLSVTELARKLRVTRQAVYERIWQGDITTEKIGGMTFIPVEEAEKWQSQKVNVCFRVSKKQ